MSISQHTDLSQRDLTVLIVEDEAVSRSALSNLLMAYGYRTAPVGSAEEALALLSEATHVDTPTPHLVALVDVDLPGMSGQEFLEKIWVQNPEMPAVLITAASRERVRAMSARGVPHLRKPVDVTELLSILAEHARPV